MFVYIEIALMKKNIYICFHLFVREVVQSFFLGEKGVYLQPMRLNCILHGALKLSLKMLTQMFKNVYQNPSW